MWYRLAILGPDYSPLEERAIEEYGITGDHRKAGYMLKDGTLLDFSEGYFERSLDHRNVSAIMPKNNQYEDDYRNYVVPFAQETGSMRLAHYDGHWNIDIIAKPTNIQISYIVSKHRNGDPFVYDVPDEEGIYSESVSKNQVFNLLKKIQQEWDEKYVV